MRRLAISLLLLLPSLGIATAADAQAWDAAPLRSATPIPRDGLPPGRSQFLAWLERQGSGLPPQQLQPALERLYVYISELAKKNAGRFPTSVDSAAPGLFWLAARLGNAGASHVVRRLSTDSALMPPPHPVPDATLTLTPPLFALASTDSSWRVCFPYYFMAAPRGRQRLPNGVLTDVVILSTLFAPDRGPAGSSQATIMLVAAAPRDSARHLQHWRDQLRVSPARAPGEDSTGAWFASAPGEQMTRLAVVRRLPKAVVVVAYIGVAGTFEANRPHFFNVLSTLGSSRCAT